MSRLVGIDEGYLDAAKLHLTIMGCFATPVCIRSAKETGKYEFDQTAVWHMAVSLVQSGFPAPPPDIGVLVSDVYPAHAFWQKLEGGGERQISASTFVARLNPDTTRAFVLSAWYVGESERVRAAVPNCYSSSSLSRPSILHKCNIY